MVRVHVEKPQGQEESGLNPEDAAMLTGVLEYKHMTVKDVMTDLDKVYMIELNTKMTFSVLMEIYKSGFTLFRTKAPAQHRGHSLHKGFVLIDPDDEIELAALLSFRGGKNGDICATSDTTTLDKVFLSLSTFTHLLYAATNMDRRARMARTRSSRVSSRSKTSSRPSSRMKLLTKPIR